jgi:hypothetical protein
VAQPIRLLKRIRESLRPDGLLGIIDRNGKGDDHGLDKDVVIEEAGRARFVLVNQYDFVKPDKVDYFLVFRALWAGSFIRTKACAAGGDIGSPQRASMFRCCRMRHAWRVIIIDDSKNAMMKMTIRI